MIVEWLVDVFARIVALLVGLLPEWEAPFWLENSIGTVASAMEDVSAYANWIPLQAIGRCVVFLLACQAIVFAIRLGRILISHFTGGGGSAA